MSLPTKGFALALFLVICTLFCLRDDTLKLLTRRPTYVIKDLEVIKDLNVADRWLSTQNNPNITEPCTACNASLHTTNASGKKSSEEYTTTVPCDGTCKLHIHFCGYFAPMLPPGTYCCTETGCNVKFTYSQRSSISTDSDAVILHHSGGWKLGSLLRKRNKNQVFIFMTREAGSKIHHRSVLYNMTMTYRFDSDFRVPYGVYNDTSPKNPEDFIKDWSKNKTKLAAWMASNCKRTSWPRADFIRNLSKLIPIDMFGRCGNGTCEKGDECRKILRNYKFYFALENQHCRDYITEKFWYNALSNDVVPIVFGATRSEYEKVAPPHSFIHLDDFSNEEDFLNYIRLLDKNPALYNSYFEWKKHGTVRRITRQTQFTKSLICDISRTLKQKKDSNTPYYFHMRKDFWDNTCRMNVLPWSK